MGTLLTLCQWINNKTSLLQNETNYYSKWKVFDVDRIIIKHIQGWLTVQFTSNVVWTNINVGNVDDFQCIHQLAVQHFNQHKTCRSAIKWQRGTQTPTMNAGKTEIEKQNTNLRLFKATESSERSWKVADD